MLFVGYQKREDFRKHSGEIHLRDGNTSLEDVVSEASPDDVCYIQADGHELQAILSQFENLLHHKGARVQVFRGNTAKFIFEHLKL